MTMCCKIWLSLRLEHDILSMLSSLIFLASKSSQMCSRGTSKGIPLITNLSFALNFFTVDSIYGIPLSWVFAELRLFLSVIPFCWSFPCGKTSATVLKTCCSKSLQSIRVSWSLVDNTLITWGSIWVLASIIHALCERSSFLHSSTCPLSSWVR